MIDSNEITTIRVGELPSEPFSLTDNLPHEVGTSLKKGTIQELSTFIAAYIGASEGVGFRAISVTDGQTLPTTIKEEFILVGKGTFYNVSGGSTIICTEELNAIVSNGSFWFIGVEIPINFEFSGITQEIRAGFLETTPSENALFQALLLKVNQTQLDNYYTKLEVNSLINEANPYNFFQPIQKGFGNILTTPQAGDIYCGWRNDGTIRYSEAIYISGSLDNSDNFTPLVQTEI